MAVLHNKLYWAVLGAGLYERVNPHSRRPYTNLSRGHNADGEVGKGIFRKGKSERGLKCLGDVLH